MSIGQIAVGEQLKVLAKRGSISIRKYLMKIPPYNRLNSANQKPIAVLFEALLRLYMATAVLKPLIRGDYGGKTI